MARRETNVILCKCVYTRSARDNLFGIRIEKIQGDWMRTWAFKIGEDKARNEGFDKENITGSFVSTPEYPGCPHCGAESFSICDCGKMFCYDPNKEQHNTEIINGNAFIHRVCPWCGEDGYYSYTNSFDMKGGGY